LANNRLLIGLACVVFGLFGAIRSWNTHIQESAIALDGVRAEGHVTRKWTRSDSEPVEDFFVGYWFDLPGGQRIEAEHEISSVRYRSLRQGDVIAVLYSPTDPRISFPEGDGHTSRRTALLVSAMGVLAALFGAGLVISQWKPPVRRRAA
jgi:hypothetical protein